MLILPVVFLQISYIFTKRWSKKDHELILSSGRPVGDDSFRFSVDFGSPEMTIYESMTNMKKP